MNLRRLAPGFATLALLLLALSVRSGLVLGFVVLIAIFVPMEKLFALHPRKTLRNRWRSDAVHLIVNEVLITVGLVVALVVAIVTLHWMVNPVFQATVHSQPAWIQFIEAVLVADVAQYWAHRASHEIPVLWRFHKVHHSIDEMDWLAAGRLHPLDSIFTRAATILPLYMLGFSRATFGGYLAFAALVAIFIHANVRFRFGPLRWLITTPEFHHWHHALTPVNKNFAGQLPILDVLFGTAHMPRGAMPDAYGISEATPDGYFAQLTWPFEHDRRTAGTYY